MSSAPPGAGQQPPPARAPPASVAGPGAAAGGAPAPQQSPLLRIRAGIEAGNVAEVQAGVREADTLGVTLAPNVRDMITQWLAVNAPPRETGPAASPPPAASSGISGSPGHASPAPAAQVAAASSPAMPSRAQSPSPPPQQVLRSAPAGNAAPRQEPPAEEVRPGDGSRNWSSTPHVDGIAAGIPAAVRPQAPKLSSDVLRSALLRFFEGAPKGSDEAAGLGIMEGPDGARYLPLPLLGRAVGLAGQDFEVAQAVWHEVNETPVGTFILSDDARGCGLVEWAGWEEFSTALAAIVRGTRDPAFEPRSIQGQVARAARGAVRAGPTRKEDVLRNLKEQLSPHDMPEDAAPALRSAISRRTRLALACLVDAIASQGLGPEAGPESMGLVGQLPRTLFGLIFDRMDDRDRGACAFLGEILDSWERRRCFSKRWLQDARNKFTIPKGSNTERDEGRGWYALTAENLHKKPKDEAPGSNSKAEGGEDFQPASPVEAPKEPIKEAKETARKDGGDRGRERDRGAERARATEASALTAEQQLAAMIASGGAGGPASPHSDGARGGSPQPGERVADQAGVAGAPKKRGLPQEEEDDETVQKHLEASRKRRAELLQKYKGGIE